MDSNTRPFACEACAKYQLRHHRRFGIGKINRTLFSTSTYTCFESLFTLNYSFILCIFLQDEFLQDIVHGLLNFETHESTLLFN